MARQIALLRGVNVGGNVLKMQRLRELWSELGFKDVETYLQSGNVVFSGAGSAARWQKTAEARLAGETRLAVTVLFRSAAELGQIITRNPFLKERGTDPAKLHVTFLAEPPGKDALKKLAAIACGNDRYHVAGTEIYLHCPAGYGNSKLANNALERVLGVRATTRNWNTVNKLHTLAGE